MLSIALKILSILGILLLCLLGLVILLVLLVLFFPIAYKLTGKKNEGELSASVRVSWLFGLLRLRFAYPEPGKIQVKILPFTVFDSGRQSASDGKSRETSGGSKEPKQESGAKEESPEVKKEEEKEAKSDNREAQDQESRTAASVERTATQEEEQEPSREEADSDDPIILKKFKKIKYTIYSIYDKIKNIWENISYYIELLQEEETKQLFSHVVFRLGKILRNIRPRHIRGQILFGTGAPDTTGYAYGVYGMLSPFLGNGLSVTPDFAGAVLEGDLYIAGHITVFTILWNVLKVLLDKKLRRFMKKMKAGRKK